MRDNSSRNRQKSTRKWQFRRGAEASDDLLGRDLATFPTFRNLFSLFKIFIYVFYELFLNFIDENVLI